MPKPRFSLKLMLGVVTFVGFAMASLTQPLHGWYPSLVLTVALALQLLSIPAGIYAKGRARAFYAGFAIVGWGYFLIVYTPWFEASVGGQLLAYPIAESICFAVTGSLGESLHYFKVCHALTMFMLAYVGGLVASRFYMQSMALPSTTGNASAYSSDSDDRHQVPSKGLSLRKVQ